MSLNKVMLIGNLGKDPDVRFTNTGKAVCSFSMATKEVWYNDKNEKQERVEWHNIVVWGKRGESCGQYLQKGRQVYVEGKIQTEKYKDKVTGEDRYSVKIVADKVDFLGTGGARTPASSNGDQSSAPDAGGPGPQGGGFDKDDDVPW